MPVDAGLIVAGVVALTKTGFGIAQHASANKDLKAAQAEQPYFKIPQEWYDDDNVAAGQAEHGLNEQALKYYSDMSGRGLSSGLGTILQAGGNPNTVSQLYDQYDTGNRKVAEEDAQLKDQHIGTFLQANANLGNEEEKRWTLNDYKPWLDRVAADNKKLGAADQNIDSGLNDLANEGVAVGTQKYGTTVQPTRTAAIDTPINPALPTNTALTPTSLDTTPLVQTPGGMDALKQSVAANPNSPYLRQLLQTLNQTNSNQLS